MADTVFRAHVVTPSAGGWRNWPDAVIRIAGSRLAHVGPWNTRRPPAAYADLRPNLLLPGLVDVHAHVPQLAVCGVHAENLLAWLRKWTFPLESRFRGERARELSRRFMHEMLAQGTTAAGLYTSAWPDSVHACFEAAEAIGVHAWIGPPLMDVGTYRRVSTRQVVREMEQLAVLDRPTLRFVVTPRFALSCSVELMERAAALAADRTLPIQTHLAEQPAECEEVQRRFGRPYLQVYADMGLLTPRTLFAHCIWLGARDWRRLARAAVAHCPTSNVFLGSGVMDWKRAQVARVGLGSDVGAGPDLSIFRVARMAWTVHSLRGAAPPPAELMRAATLGGAEALGFEDEIGSLEAGKAADFVVLDRGHIVPPGAPSEESTDDLLSRILHRAGRSAVRQVYVGGQLRFENAQ